MAESTSLRARLAVKNLSVSYGGNTVVRDVSLAVQPGESVALLGRNGAGKTTTLMAIAGAVPLAAGSVEIDGVSVAKLPAHAIARRGLTLVPQGRRIFESLTVRENLALARRGADAGDVYRLFPILAERGRQLGSTLSGGEQQMLAIGRALMTRPTVLLMDEPSEGLALPVIRTIGELIQELRREQAISILLAEQNLSLALGVADRVYVLERGQVVHEGPADTFREDRDLQKRHLGV